jgi:hypothetical protein
MDSIVTIQQLLGRHTEYHIEVHLLFVDYIKAFGLVLRKNCEKQWLKNC